jgi:hypothetical protein
MNQENFSSVANMSLYVQERVIKNGEKKGFKYLGDSLLLILRARKRVRSLGVKSVR